MKSSVVSVVVTIIVLIVSLIVLPTYFKSIENTRDDKVKVQNAMRNFLDVCIDNRKVPEEAIQNLNIDLAACTAGFSYTIRRDQKLVTPTTDGSYVISWVTVGVDPEDELAQGDFIILTVKQDSLSIYQRIAAILSSSSYEEYNTQISAMVR